MTDPQEGTQEGGWRINDIDNAIFEEKMFVVQYLHGAYISQSVLCAIPVFSTLEIIFNRMRVQSDFVKVVVINKY